MVLIHGVFGLLKSSGTQPRLHMALVDRNSSRIEHGGEMGQSGVHGDQCCLFSILEFCIRSEGMFLSGGVQCIWGETKSKTESLLEKGRGGGWRFVVACNVYHSS